MSLPAALNRQSHGTRQGGSRTPDVADLPLPAREPEKGAPPLDGLTTGGWPTALRVRATSSAPCSRTQAVAPPRWRLATAQRSAVVPHARGPANCPHIASSRRRGAKLIGQHLTNELCSSCRVASPHAPGVCTCAIVSTRKRSASDGPNGHEPVHATTPASRRSIPLWRHAEAYIASRALGRELALHAPMTGFTLAE